MYCGDLVPQRKRSASVCFSLFVLCLVVLLAGCGGGSSIVAAMQDNKPTPIVPQVLTIPNVGVTDITSLDPVLGSDINTSFVMKMVYSGLVRLNSKAQVEPDQALWKVSSDGKVYTFSLKPGITFSDGTPVTAQSYIYTWTRALSPKLNAAFGFSLEQPIEGAAAVYKGEAQTISGLRAIDERTLQVTLTKPAPYFLTSLTNPLFFPLNQEILSYYKDQNWTPHMVSAGIGTGPFIIKSWQHNVAMVLVPNAHYYGEKTRLQTVNIRFVADPKTLSYSASQYDFTWSLSPAEQDAQKNTPGFRKTPLWETAWLFFDTSSYPFDQVAVRQAFAMAIDKTKLLHVAFNDMFVLAPSLLSDGMPGHQQNYTGLSYNPSAARTLLSSEYPDPSAMPQVTFSYPVSSLPKMVATNLQQMWQNVLGIQVDLAPLEPDAYQQEMEGHGIQLGFHMWRADFPDPYNALATNLLSSSPYNAGQWQNDQFDSLIKQAEAQTREESRLQMYNQAEKLVIADAALVPLYHSTFSAIIPSWVQGVSINGEGLFFGDWSGVFVLNHKVR
jgi:oligopeptide transport system substrate-binding protein